VNGRNVEKVMHATTNATKWKDNACRKNWTRRKCTEKVKNTAKHYDQVYKVRKAWVSSTLSDFLAQSELEVCDLGVIV
jgi:hypothetical protein